MFLVSALLRRSDATPLQRALPTRSADDPAEDVELDLASSGDDDSACAVELVLE